MFRFLKKLFSPQKSAEPNLSDYGMGEFEWKKVGPIEPLEYPGITVYPVKPAPNHGLGELEWKKTSWVAPEGVKTWAGDSCPKCGAKVNTNGGHGPWCPDPLCKWGWETEMDGSPLIHPNLKVWSEPKE